MRAQENTTRLHRTFIGFENLIKMIEQGATNEQKNTYPPYNIEHIAEDKYRITMAIAGFTEQEIDIESESGTLVVSGKKAPAEDEGTRQYLHQGIASRDFSRRFQLEAHVNVTEASLAHGLLHIDLLREVPDAMKPKKIAIGKSPDVS